MRAKRAARAMLAATAAYLVGSLVAAPILISASLQAVPAARPLLAVAEAAPQTTSAQPAAGSTNSTSQQTPASAGSLSNTSSTAAATTPTTTSTTPSSTQPSDPNAIDESSCTQQDGGFSWVFCPFFDGVSHTFADGAKDLISNFLAVQPLTQGQDCQGAGPQPNCSLYNTWNSLRLLADVSFVLIFLVLIFAQTVQFDLSAYTIKKIIPKLVASALLVQFSFVLSSVIVDIGNILGAGVGQLINTTISGGATASFDLGTLTENLLAGGTLVALAVVAWELALPLFFMVLISIFAMILTLAIRYLLIGILIVVSPLAFAAWVLPNTERYFNLWLKTFIKLVLMYPIIIALLSLAANVNALVPAAASTGSSVPGSGITTTIIKVLVFIACFGAIPQTFKWAGGAMAQAAGAVDGMRRWGHKRVHDSDNWKNRQARVTSKQIARQGRMENGLQPLMGSQNRVIKGAGGGLFTAGSILLAGRTGTSSAARQRGSSQLVANYKKEIEGLKETGVPNVRNALLAHYATGPKRDKALQALREEGADSLRDYTQRIEGRQALVRWLGDKDLMNGDVMNAVQHHSTAFGRPEEFQMVLRENEKNMFNNPGLYARHKRSDPNETNPLTGQPVRMGDVHQKVAADAFGSITAAKLRSDVKPETWKAMSNHDGQQATSISQQLATVFGEAASPTELQQAFAHGSRGFNSATTRAEVLKGMARNEAQVTSSSQGSQTWNAVIDQIKDDQRQDKSRHADILRLLAAQDDGMQLLQTLDLVNEYSAL